MRAWAVTMGTVAGLLVHGFTASSAVLAFLALDAGLDGRARAAFLLLAAAVVVDSVDGTLARAVGIKRTAPWFDGARMDDVVDYLTFVFVPVFLLLEWDLLPRPGALGIAACPLLASALGFVRTDAKTADHFFTGFPSYWNIVALYLYLAGSPPWVNGAVLVALSVLVFVPVRYVYPSRTPVLRGLTNVLGALWGVAVLVLIWQIPEPSRLLLAVSAVYPVYYVGLSSVLEWRRRRAGPAARAA